MCATKSLFISCLHASIKLSYHHDFHNLEVYYLIKHNDVHVIGLLQVEVTVAGCVLINVNLYRKIHESIPCCM